ncbi:CBS domain-containing protein [Thiocapsa sp.]|uniref:CBS domain-containing protein n=1 Tax=Thiocapsa sp. TaxID=2024551 RepID=UPI002616DFD3|nr:CBS domain-containing protein [Thiocapsa sp.]
MRSPIQSLHPMTPLDQAAGLFVRQGVKALPVVAGGELVSGILNETDILKRFGADSFLVRGDRRGYDVKISKGFSELKPSAYSTAVKEPTANYRVAPADKSNMSRYLFGGFERCLYPVQKFESDAERKLTVILEREAAKWFRPARGQFQIHYRDGADHREFQPDFVAETDAAVYMLEPKMRKEMEDPSVIAKKEAAVGWCANASVHALSHGGKPWRYLLIPHDAIAENMTLSGLACQYGG